MITRTGSAETTTRPTKPDAGETGHSTTTAGTTVAQPVATTTSGVTTVQTTVSVVRGTEPTKTTPTNRVTTTDRTTTRPTTTTTTTSAPPTAKVVSFGDPFEGDYVDPTIWHRITTDDHVSIAETGGRLVLTVGADAQPTGQYNSIDVHVGTQCSFPGNFDARVDFELLEWPSADNVFVGLSAFYADSAVGRQFSPQWGDQYSGWVVPNGASVPLPDMSGSLRVKRVGAVETTYFWHRGAWQKLATGTSRGSAVLGLQAMWAPNGGNAPFGAAEAKVAYDNFRITGANPVCQPGSQPPGG